MEAVELGNVVYLHVIADAISKAGLKSAWNSSVECLIFLHAMASWSVSIILASNEIIRIVILELLLKR